MLHVDELELYVRQNVCEEHDLDPEHASRLRGRSVSELRDDARRLRHQLGLDHDPARDPQGRFASGASSMNDAIRNGRGTTIETTTRERDPEGRLGAGIGGTNAPVEADMSELIRQASGR